jgi:putative DNA primase/helicase
MMEPIFETANNTVGAYSVVGEKLVQAGYSAIPLVPHKKRPALNNWTEFCHRLPTSEEVDSWAAHSEGYGVGIACGFNDLVCVDIDDPRVEEAVIAVTGMSPVVRRGAKGKGLFFRGPAEKTKQWRGLLDYLASGRQSVLPPSIHEKSGQPYVWIGQKALQDIDIDELPTLSDDVLDRLEIALGPFVTQNTKIEEHVERDPLRPTAKDSQGHHVPVAGSGRYVIDNDGVVIDASHPDWARYCGIVRARLNLKAEDVAGAAPGGRNDTLWRKVRALAGYAAATDDAITEGQVREAMLAAYYTNGAVGDDRSERPFHATFRHNWRKGYMAPWLPRLDSKTVKCELSDLGLLSPTYKTADEAWAAIDDDPTKVVCMVSRGDPEPGLIERRESSEQRAMQAYDGVVAAATSMDDLENRLFEATQTDGAIMEYEHLYSRIGEHTHYVAVDRPEAVRRLTTNGTGVIAIYGDIGESIPASKRPQYRWFTEKTVITEHGEIAPGVYKFDRGRELTCTRISRRPFHVIAATKHFDNEEYGIQVRFLNMDNQWNTCFVPYGLISGQGDKLCELLGRKGVEPIPAHKALLVDYIARSNTYKRLVSTDMVGWVDDRTFALPDRAYGLIAEKVVFEGNAEGYLSRGTPDEWRSGVATLAKGNPVLAFALCCSFAGPLLKLCGIENGGFHLDADSSSGKTTALKAAGSVWGEPRDGKHIKTWRATANALEGHAELYNDNLLPLDEIGQGDPREMSAAIYTIANGASKGRAKAEGGVRSTRTWRVMVLSTGERSFATRLAEIGEDIKRGQEVRIVDLPAKRAFGAWDELHGEPDGAAFSRRIDRGIADCYGVAGRAFLERLTQDVVTSWPDRWNDMKGGFPPRSDDGQDHRVAVRFALVALAGETAIEYGILPWAKGDAIAAAKTMMDVYNQHSVAGNGEDRQILEAVAGFIDRHESRFDPIRGSAPGTAVRDRAGWIDNDGVFLFTSGGLHEATRGHNFGRALVALKKASVLVCRSDRGGESRKIHGGSVRVYPIQRDKLNLDVTLSRPDV